MADSPEVAAMKNAAKASNVICPWCYKGDFDRFGLKRHLVEFGCSEFEALLDYEREADDDEEGQEL